MRLARRAGDAVLGLLLPAICLTCDALVEAPGLLCPDCFNATRFIGEPCCIQCGQGFAHEAEGGASGVCAACRDDPPAWRQARAALCYDAQSRRIILPLKYQDRTEIASALARHMARAGATLLDEADLLVPVPLHRARLRARRYNQSALLARAIGRRSGHPIVLDALRRLRNTRPLAGRSPEARRREVSQAFALRASRAALVQGRRVLLVDDILTTGATAGACARTLLESGAAQVDLLVAARVPWQGQDRGWMQD